MSVGSDEVERASPPFTRDRRAHLWILTRTMSAVTDSIWSIGLAWTAVQVGSPGAAGMVVAAGTVPRAVLGLLGGDFADRFDIRSVMIWSNIVRLLALLGVIVAAVSVGPSYAMLIAAAILLGASDAMYDPAAATVARQLVHPSDIPKYTGVYQAVGRMGGLLGSAVGGFVVANWAIQGTALLNVAAFGGVLLFVLFGLKLRYPIGRGSQPRTSVVGGILSAFSHLKSESVTRSLVISQMFINVFIMPPLGLGVALRVQELGFGADVVGYIGVAVGVGATIGAFLTTRLTVRRPGLLGYALFAIEGLGIAVLGLGGVETLYIGGFVMGVCAGAASSMLGAVFMTQVRGEYIGRMMAFSQLGDDVLMPLSAVTFGLIVGATSASFGLVVFGLAMFIVMCLPLRNVDIRRMTAT